MSADSETLQLLSSTVQMLQKEVARLNERLAALEQRSLSSSAAAPAAGPVDETISDEELAVISAAIAAFLGKKPHIRQIRLVGSRSWAQQGRATIQASHMLTR